MVGCVAARAGCRYVSALLLSLSVMLHLEMPHVNVLSKIDLLRQYGRLGAFVRAAAAAAKLGSLDSKGNRGLWEKGHVLRTLVARPCASWWSGRASCRRGGGCSHWMCTPQRHDRCPPICSCLSHLFLHVRCTPHRFTPF